ncbi:hypothetical protein JOD24_003130 [Kroppenstedtia sanguinis]|uniref:Uncharacterized protein n=1 Tax=Kroppenstedtia sanguinis TaxID=1380684 RepID=A0ABW4CDK1_9BACL
MINQKMGGGRESCATKATTFVPWALQSKGAEALDEGSHPAQRRIWREGVKGQHSSLCCFRKALLLPDRKIWSGQFLLPCRMATERGRTRSPHPKYG